MLNKIKNWIINNLSSTEFKNRVKNFMIEASSLIKFSGQRKKAYVIDKVIAYQQKYLKIKFIPKKIQIIILRWILNTLIEKIYKEEF